MSDSACNLELASNQELIEELKKRHARSFFILNRETKNEAGSETLVMGPGDLITALGMVEYARTQIRFAMAGRYNAEMDK